MYELNLRVLEGNLKTEAQTIELSVAKAHEVFKVLFHGKINLIPFMNWFIENEELIRTCEVPSDFIEYDNKSIAEKISLINRALDVGNDSLIDLLYDYRSSHCLRFACRGSDFPEIYIGKSGDYHEISLYNENECWRFNFEICNFYYRLKSLLLNNSE